MRERTQRRHKAFRFLALASGFFTLCLVTGVVSTYGSSMQGMPLPSPKPAYMTEVSLRAMTPSRSVAAGKEEARRLTSSADITDEEAEIYREVFAAQDRGDWQKADALRDDISNNILIGHVLHQRYTHPSYKTSYAELKSWLKSHGDHPGADRLYDLAVKRKPSGEGLPPKPRTVYGTSGRLDLDAGQTSVPYVGSKKPAGVRSQAAALERTVRQDLRRDRPSAALARLETADAKKVFDMAERDDLLGEVAASYFYHGKQDKAFEVAAPAVERSGSEAPMAGWIAGLMAWKKGDYARASGYFGKVAQSPRVSAWMASAGGFWAARAHMRNHAPKEANQYLKMAARHPRSFYGLLALQTLGLRQDVYNWQTPGLDKKHLAELGKLPSGARALALLKVGQNKRAETELVRVNAGDNTIVQEALIAVAESMNLPSLAMRIGSAITREDGGFYDAVLYPVAPWQPENGFDVDRALIYALIRQESRFEPGVSNGSSGAVGLMQLMPATASHILGVKKNHFTGKQGKAKLADPAFNMDLGQKYLNTLLGLDYIDGNLFKLAVAYNAGPGKLQRWARQLDYKDDPLLFIESIPVAETRMFVEKVLANYWIYSLRLKQGTPTLEDVAEGSWPIYRKDEPRKSFRIAALTQFLNNE